MGALHLGGAVPAERAASLPWVPYSSGGAYVISLTSMKRGGATLDCPSADYRSTIVDSGTSFTYLPPKAYRAVRDYYLGANPESTKAPPARAELALSCSRARSLRARRLTLRVSLQVAGQYDDDYCFRRPRSAIHALDAFAFHFGNGVELSFGPPQYAYELDPGVWCLGVFDNERRGAVIGAATMRQCVTRSNLLPAALCRIAASCWRVSLQVRDSIRPAAPPRRLRADRLRGHARRRHALLAAGWVRLLRLQRARR